MKNEIIVIAEFIAKDGQAEKLHAALNELLIPTRSEAGCLSYALCQSLDNPRLFTMIEKYKNQSAFEYHIKQPYLVKFQEAREAWVESALAKFYKLADTPKAKASI